MKKRVLSALLALCLTLSLAGAAFAENETLSPAQETSVSESASSAAEPQEEKESEVEAEEISTAETAQEPSYPAQDFEAAVDGADMTVNVSAPEGALPEGVTLTSSLVGSSEDNADDQAVADVAAELDDADVEYDGFVALDISFVDSDGNKVEPLQPVSVNFTLPAELLPEDVDASTLEVQHLKEDAETEEVVAVETVADTADATEGTVTVEGAAVTLAEESKTTLSADATVAAEFEVYGFSVFTITWDRNQWFYQQGKIEFHIVDTDGNELTLPDAYQSLLSLELTDEYTHNFEDIVKEKGIAEITIGDEVYNFRNATLVVDGTDRHPVVSIRKDGNNVIFQDAVYPGETGVYTRGDRPIIEGGYLNKGEWVEFVYRRQDESDVEVFEPEPVYTKQAVTTDGGKTYDLSLTVSGDTGESTNIQKVDVLFIVDQSASMSESGRDYQKMVASCANNLANSLANNTNLSTRFAVVTFSSELVDQKYYKDALQRLSWTSDASKIYSAANPKSTGGTNYQAGLMAGRMAMIESRPDALKYVIFLSDGEPTYHYDSIGETKGGANYTQTEDIENALTEAKNYNNINGFFTISVGSESTAGTYLDRLSDTVREATGASASSKNFEDYTAAGSTELQQRFDEIQAQITKLAMKNVVITDTLSNWIEPVEGETPFVVVKNDDGNQVQTENSCFEIKDYSLDADTVKFTVDFDDNYELKQGYTYEVHLRVQPTQDAYTTYATTGYPEGQKGEANTGTYAGQDGFYSNVEGSAKLTYDTDISKGHSENYPMPVIQVPSTSITINKVFVKNDGTVLTQNEIESILPIDFTVKNGDEVISTVQLTKDDRKEDGTYSVEVPNLVVTKTYTIEENSTSAQLSGYDLAVSVNKPQDAGSAVASIVANKDVSQNAVTFTNTYTPQNKQLTVTKTVTGEMGSNDKSFDFTLSLTKTENGNTVYYGAKNGETIKVVSSNMEEYEQGKVIVPNEASTGEVTYSFKLKHGKQIVFDVPYGYTATLHEEADGYTATFTVDGKPVEGAQPAPVMDRNHTVAYTNRLDPVAPTGLEDNHTKPFGLMVGVAVMAGLALVGGAVVRRRRRWME